MVTLDTIAETVSQPLDIQEMKDLYIQGVKLDRIAAHFGYKSDTPIRYHMKKIGVPQRGCKYNRNPNHTPWTKEDEELLLSMRKDKRLWKEIAHEIGRSEVACRAKLNHMTRDTSKEEITKAASDWLWYGIKANTC